MFNDLYFTGPLSLFLKFCSIFHPIISGWELSHFFLTKLAVNSKLMQSTSPLTPWPFSTVKMSMPLPSLSLGVSTWPLLQAPVQFCIPHLCVTEPCCAQATLWWMALSLPSISLHCLTPKQKSLGPQVTSNYTF